MFAGATAALSALLAAGAMLAWAMPTGNVAGPLARMLDGYAPWLLGAALILALLCAGLGARRTGAALTLLIAAGGIVQVGAYRDVTRPLDPAREADLGVLFFNVLAGNDANGARIVEAAIGTGADILVFAEAEALVAELDTLSEAYAFVSPCTEAACELLIATNLSVIRSWRLDLNPVWDGRYAVLEVEIPGRGPAFVAAGHLMKPWMSGIAEPELARLTAQLNWLDGPSVVVGDFNMPPWSRPMRALLGDTGFLAIQGGPGTWPASAPGALRLPIDHVLVRDDVAITSVMPFGEGLGSNHLGLIAGVALP
jgi:endonuclease/exonuclease/phosphatase (EEP) superfamily protein YafD